MKTEIDYYITEKVKERRIELNFTQEDLSYRIGYSRSYVGNVEINPKHRYTTKSLYLLSIELKCSIKDFFPDDEKDLQQFLSKNSNLLK